MLVDSWYPPTKSEFKDGTFLRNFAFDVFSHSVAPSFPSYDCLSKSRPGQLFFSEVVFTMKETNCIRVPS